MKHDIRDGFGMFQWANGDEYEGEWLTDRMEGKGVFEHHEAGTFEGTFKNNYFYMNS